jgi:hypothetical protein
VPDDHRRVGRRAATADGGRNAGAMLGPGDAQRRARGALGAAGISGRGKQPDCRLAEAAVQEGVRSYGLI